MASKAVVKTNGKQQLIDPKKALEYFKIYGDEAMVGGNIVGDLLIFSKGNYQRGQNKDDVEDNMRVVVNMNSLLVGWVFWEDKKPVEQRMGALAEGHQPEKRSELGHQDEKEWPVDPTNKSKRRDPWVFSNQFLCKDPTNGDVLTFSTSSRGGLNAIQALCRAYADKVIEHEGEMPVIELGVDSYEHKEFGTTYVPIFPIVDWSDDLDFEVHARPVTVKKPKKPARRPSTR